MASFWNDPDGISIKDVLGVTFGLLFTGVAIYTLTTNILEGRQTGLDILKVISPIIITIVGGYALSEGARGVANSIYQTPNTYYPPQIPIQPSETPVVINPPVGVADNSTPQI